MAFYPHTVQNLAISDSEGTDGKNIVSGAVITVTDTLGNTALIYDDAAGNGAATSKITDSKGKKIIYLPAGEFNLSVNGESSKLIITPSGITESGGAALIGESSGGSVQDRLNSLSANQVSGVIVFETYALLDAYTPANTDEERALYRVSNDSTSSNNGYYRWISGTAYTKAADIYQSAVVESNTSEGVTGEAVYKFAAARTDLAFSNIVELDFTTGFYLESDGSTSAFASAGYTDNIYVYGNGSRTLLYSGQYGNDCVAFLFRDSDLNIISAVTKVGTAATVEEVSIPSNAYYMQISTLQNANASVVYIEESIPSVSAKVDRKVTGIEAGLIDLSGVSRTSNVLLQSDNTVSSFTGARVYEAIDVTAGARIWYDCKFGGSAVAMLFLDNKGDVISFVDQTSNDFYQGYVDVPTNAEQVRFGVTTTSPEPVFGYVNKINSDPRLVTKSWNAVGDSITEGSSIQTNEGITAREAEKLVYVGLIGRRNRMIVTNNGAGGTRIAAYNPYGRTISYLNGANTVLGYDEIHYLPLNGSANGKTFNAPTGCTKVRMTIQYTDSGDANNSISDLSGTLSFKQGDDLTSGTELYSSGDNVSGSYVKYDGSLQADATGIYVEIPVTAGLQYSFSDVYEFGTIGAYRYNSFVDRISDILTEETDFLTIMGGTNDRNEYILGDIDSESPYEIHGALNLMIKQALDTYPLMHIGLMTVLRFNTNSYIDDLAQAVIDIGDKWSVPVLDMRKRSGLDVVNVTDWSATHYDTIHPNIDGNEKMSWPIENFLKSL